MMHKRKSGRVAPKEVKSVGNQFRALRDVAADIERHWPNIKNGAARQALEHMKRMGSIDDPFHLDSSGHGVVGTFLVHSIGWRGPDAQRVKKELRSMCDHPRP
jgi:hypothetical protein